MKGLDLSFAQPPSSWWQARRQEGYRVAVINAWTGVATPQSCLTNLSRAADAGFGLGVYGVVNDGLGSLMVAKVKNACGDLWPKVKAAVVDVELAGATPDTVRDAVDGFRKEKKKTYIYTGKWFWDFWMVRWGVLDFGDVESWIADYDGVPTLDTPSLLGLGEVKGKQYAGTTQIDGQAVDLNVFSEDFLKEDEMADLTQADKEWFIYEKFNEVLKDVVNQHAKAAVWKALGVKTADEFWAKVRENSSPGQVEDALRNVLKDGVG